MRICAGLVGPTIENMHVTAGKSKFLKGQMWGSLLRGDDPPIGRSNYEQSWGYIPTVSYKKDLTNLINYWIKKY